MNEMLGDKLANFSKALTKLEEALQDKGHALTVDGTIQRFEFTFETAWKAMKKFLLVEGYDCSSARDCLKKAFQWRYIGDEQAWLDMLRDRNSSSHLYDEALAKDIYRRIETVYLPQLRKLAQTLKDKITSL